jgi:hypothetical protein
MELRSLHPEKVSSPIVVRPAGKFIELRLSHSKKALSPIAVTPLGICTSSAFPRYFTSTPSLISKSSRTVILLPDHDVKI